MAKILVTGAAGFIGSHLTDAVAKGNSVIAIDNLSSGKRSNIADSKHVVFVEGDIRNMAVMEKVCAGVEVIYHFAADPLVRESATRPLLSFDINVAGTLRLLEAARKNDVAHIVFASSSAVYGDAKKFPTPETHPAIPISNYAASKMACECYVSSYCETYGMKGTVLRYANIYGPRSVHGVMHDFYFKLAKNPERMEILGDGRQTKSYLYVSDCISATLLAAKKQKTKFDVFNVGSDTTASATDLAKIVSSYMKLRPKFEYSGGKRGWAGDVTKMRLDVAKLKRLTGWRPKVPLKKGVALYLDWLASQ